MSISKTPDQKPRWKDTAFNIWPTKAADAKGFAPRQSWWTTACQPNERESFIAIARERADTCNWERTLVYREAGETRRRR